MKLDDITVSKAIIEGFMQDFLDYTDMDVAIGGGGPARSYCRILPCKSRV